jgi:hypothetical protein
MEHATMHAILHYLYDFLSFWTDERELKHHLLARIERSGDHIFGVNMSSAACRAAKEGESIGGWIVGQRNGAKVGCASV